MGREFAGAAIPRRARGRRELAKPHVRASRGRGVVPGSGADRPRLRREPARDGLVGERHRPCAADARLHAGRRADLPGVARLCLDERRLRQAQGGVGADPAQARVRRLVRAVPEGALGGRSRRRRARLRVAAARRRPGHALPEPGSPCHSRGPRARGLPGTRAHRQDPPDLGLHGRAQGGRQHPRHALGQPADAPAVLALPLADAAA